MSCNPVLLRGLTQQIDLAIASPIQVLELKPLSVLRECKMRGEGRFVRDSSSLGPTRPSLWNRRWPITSPSPDKSPDNPMHDDDPMRCDLAEGLHIAPQLSP